MDIGVEISEKIQKAIKAKLTEINAYIDDELPDYIMIMIANRKAEEQMADSLSLFLGNNAKVFTKWLYELLTNLCGYQVPVEKTTTKLPIDNKEAVVQKPQTKVPIDDAKSKDDTLTKPSRWDIQIHAKQDKKSSKKEEKEIKNDAESAPKEAVIDILPEMNDLFDDEMNTSNPTPSTLNKSNEHVKTKSKKGESKLSGQTQNTKVSSNDATAKDTKASSIKKRVEKKSHDRKQNDNIEQAHQSATVSSQMTAPSQSKKHASNHKRNVSVKSSRSSTRKESASSKDAEHKVKRKKLKRSSERESSSHKRKSPKSSYTREWDKSKGRERLSYKEPNPMSKKHCIKEESDEEEDFSKKRVQSRVSSSVTSIVKGPVYVSDDESDNDKKVSSKVTSKVAIPERRPRLAPGKQANRSLLLKAVSEAESSIRKHRLANKMIEPISEKTFKTRVEQQKILAIGGLVEKRKVPKQNETKHSSLSTKLLQQTNLLTKSESKLSVQKSNLRKNIAVKRKSNDVLNLRTETVNCEDPVKETNAPVAAKAAKISDQEMLQPKQFGDTRVIVSRDVKPVDKKVKKMLRRQSDNDVPSVQFDSRNLLLKALPKKADSVQSEVPVKKAVQASPKERKAMDTAAPKSPLKKNRSPSPCFIVTLDGTCASQTLKNTSDKEPVKASLHSTSVQAPAVIAKTNVSASSTSKSHSETPANVKGNVLENENLQISKLHSKASENVKENVSKNGGSSSNKSNTVESNDNVSDAELLNMRKKLLKMQADAMKMKEIQLKQQILVQKKTKPTPILEKPDSRSIHIANVHFSATEKQISEHFSICGKVLRVTILKDAFTNHPKGFAYLEFEEEKSVDVAMALDNTSFCGRNITVSKKESDISAKTVYPAHRSFVPQRQRFVASRGFSRYSSRFPPTAKAWTRNPLTKNKTWVKPGFTPS